MPIIPLLQTPGPISALPAPVLDRQRRPTVNLGRQIGAAGNLGAASQMPLDGIDYAAPMRALGAVGEAVARTGSVLGALAMKRQEATDRRLVNQAQSAMDQAALEFRSWQEANPNAPEAWVEEARKRSEAIMQPFLQMKELSNAAKGDLKLMGQSWQQRFVGGVDVEATKATFGLAKQSYVQRAERAFEAGDEATGRAALSEAKSAGYLHDVDFEALEAAGTEKAKALRKSNAETMADTFILRGQPDKARGVLQDNADAFQPAELENKVATVEERAMKAKNYQDLLVMANDDPASAASLAIEDERRGKIDATMRVDIERKAQSVLASNRSVAAREYAERIDTPGMMPSEAEITMDGRLNDFDREMLRRKITGATWNQEAEFEGALAKVMAFDPSAFESEQDAITAATNMEASIESAFSGAYAANLKAELEKRRQGPGPQGGGAATDIGPAMATLDAAIEEGGLGEIRKPVMQDGKPVMRDPRKEGFVEKPGWLWGTSKKNVIENDGQPVAVTEADPVAEAKARAIQKEIRETIQREIKEGKLKDQGAITARALDLFKLKGGRIKSRPAPVVTPPDADGMPTSGGVPLGPNPLLPNIDDTLKQYGY
jgi:hypothetical protein